eukprot:Seg3779.5 transcript_id=Seg3779.5/GoldUCD/mRNA.D3Y31 product="hypothetical protein" protein_id=Seg3779.5/GoldUCD/D3Y31
MKSCIPCGIEDRSKKIEKGQMLKDPKAGDLRLRLLDHDPIPSLKSMTEFVQRYRAIHMDCDPFPICAAPQATVPPQRQLEDSITNLTPVVAALSSNQIKLHTAMEEKVQQQQSPKWRNQRFPRKQ